MNTSKLNLILLSLASLTILASTILVSSIVSADDSVVDEINITVPVSCTMSGTGMNTHSTEINNGLYVPDIGTTTMHALCNDNEGFAIYAAGYTGNEIGGENSNKLVGTAASSNAVIESGIATSAGNPDISNWAMKLAISQDSGDTTGTNAFTIDSAPNVAFPSQAEQGAVAAPFSQYHIVPNEYVKVAHKNSGTDTTANTGGVRLAATYAAYISKTQAADTYSGKVKYTLVHPSSAPAPVGAGKVGVTYHANGSTFAGGAATNRVVYDSQPMYIATTPLIAKSSNVANDGTKTTAYVSDANDLVPITAAGASKMKVVVDYGVSSGTGLMITPSEWDGQSGLLSEYEMISDGYEDVSGANTYIFDGDSITIYLLNFNGTAPVTDYDYGFWAQVYPVYETEQIGTEPTTEFGTIVSAGEGIYAQTVDWYGSWYADINNKHYDFMDEADLMAFLSDDSTTLGGTNIDLYRGVTFVEAYARANKTQNDGYYKQQDLNNSMCQTVAITQNQTVKDIRDDNTYMIGKLKDGRCWMLDNLALDPTDATTAANMNANNTNATTEAIVNYLNGGSSTVGWSNVPVVNKTSGWNTTSPNNAHTQPYINNQSKDTLVTSYGPASTNGQARVGVYYNFCAATVGTYCYEVDNAVDIPDTLVDAPQDVCPINWRMPTGGSYEVYGVYSEYEILIGKYDITQNASDVRSLQYNLSTPLSGCYYSSNSECDHMGPHGFWWSSTYANGYGNWHLTVDSMANYIDNGVAQSRSDGKSLRCLVAD